MTAIAANITERFGGMRLNLFSNCTATSEISYLGLSDGEIRLASTKRAAAPTVPPPARRVKGNIFTVEDEAAAFAEKVTSHAGKLPYSSMSAALRGSLGAFYKEIWNRNNKHVVEWLAHHEIDTEKVYCRCLRSLASVACLFMNSAATACPKCVKARRFCNASYANAAEDPRLLPLPEKLRMGTNVDFSFYIVS